MRYNISLDIAKSALKIYVIKTTKYAKNGNLLINNVLITYKKK